MAHDHNINMLKRKGKEGSEAWHRIRTGTEGHLTQSEHITVTSAVNARQAEGGCMRNGYPSLPSTRGTDWPHQGAGLELLHT